MADGFVPFGQNLQLQSGVPLAKVGSVLAEKLTLTKRMEGGSGGGMGGLLRSVIRDGNLSSIMQNPAAALTSAVQGQIGGLVGQLQGMAGGGPQGLIQALTGSPSVSIGLGQAMGLLRSSGDNLAGLTNGAQGFFAMIGHANTAEMAGSALPPQAALSEVTGPLTASPFLSQVAERLPVVVAGVVNGGISPTEAQAWVEAQTYTAGMIVASSAAALAWGEQMHPVIATVATVSGALAVPPVFDAAGNRLEGAATGFQGVLGAMVQPDARAAMDAALEAQIAHEKHAPIDVAALTSLEG